MTFGLLAGPISDKRGYPGWFLVQNNLAKTNNKVIIADDYCFKFLGGGNKLQSILAAWAYDVAVVPP